MLYKLALWVYIKLREYNQSVIGPYIYTLNTTQVEKLKRSLFALKLLRAVTPYWWDSYYRSRERIKFDYAEVNRKVVAPTRLGLQREIEFLETALGIKLSPPSGAREYFLRCQAKVEHKMQKLKDELGIKERQVASLQSKLAIAESKLKQLSGDSHPKEE